MEEEVISMAANYFYLGNPIKALKEFQDLEGTELNNTCKERISFYSTIIYLSLNDPSNTMKAVNSLSNQNAKIVLENLVKYFTETNLDPKLMGEVYSEMTDDDIKRKDPSNSLTILSCGYLLYCMKQYESLLKLIGDIDQIDINYLKFYTYYEYYRYDYMETTLISISKLFPDSTMHSLLAHFLEIAKGISVDISNLNDIAQKFDTSLRLYNIIALGYLQLGERWLAQKIIEKALNETDIIKNPQKWIGNTEAESLVINICLCIDDLSDKIKDYEEILKKINPESEYFKTNENISKLVDDAIKNV